jgi:dipeptidyl aminopeptidase/acylaminoacyl peptidase
MKTSFLSLIMLCFSLPLIAQNAPAIASDIEKQTHTFVERDSALELDFYQKAGDTETRPCLIFMFGGGFVEGARNVPFYNEYYNFLVDQGIKVVAIDYRLGLRGRFDEVGIFNTAPLKDAIDMAVEDLYAATSYLLKHADELGIDPERVLISGSSAGAITSLQGDWYKRNNDALSVVLPNGFQYRGVIAFAGAIFSVTGKPDYDQAPAPTLFFHGTEDSTVPYNKRKLFNKGFFGSAFLADRFDYADYTYRFFSVKGAGHEIAGSPIYDHQPEIWQFIRTAVLSDQRYQMETSLKVLEAAEND